MYINCTLKEKTFNFNTVSVMAVLNIRIHVWICQNLNLLCA